MIVAWLSRTIAVPEAALRLLISVLIGELLNCQPVMIRPLHNRQAKKTYRFSFY